MIDNNLTDDNYISINTFSPPIEVGVISQLIYS